MPHSERKHMIAAVGMAVVASLGLATLGIGHGADAGGLAAVQEPVVPPSYLTNQIHDVDLKDNEDAFGIDYIYPSEKRGTNWVSNWSGNRGFSGKDPRDPWFDSDHGTARYRVRSDKLLIDGETPRMYIHDPRMERQWHDVEITVYAMRDSDDNTPYAGITAVARANHLETESGSADPCDTRGYGGRFRFDGYSDFEKETKHPQNDAVSEKRLFHKRMPRGVWIGYKFVVYDVGDYVHLELYRDMTEGEDGGHWQKVNSFVDSGNDFGVVPCADDVDPMMTLTNSESRDGSESGKPNISVYFRSDGINGYGLQYKWASVREINP
jgi:hypothetical protein